jgi:hypothetical protein
VFSIDLTGTTTGSEGQNESLCYYWGTSGIEADMWFCWTADATGVTTATTCALASFDTKLAAYPGCDCPTDGTALACNDDACGGFQSSISWPTTSQTTCTLQVGTFPGATGGLGAIDISTAPPPGPGFALCFGDGNGTPCPCANSDGPGAGCRNTTGVGCELAATGSNSVLADDLVLTATGALAAQPGLFFQGENFINGGNGLAFGDGLRCCGSNVFRVQIVFPDASGTASTSESVAENGGAQSGDTRCYQSWYRDPSGGGVCGWAFNLSNAYSVSWTF